MRTARHLPVALSLALAIGGCAAPPRSTPGLDDPPARFGPVAHLSRLGATGWNGLWAMIEAAVLVPASPYLLFWDISIGVVVAGPQGASALREGAGAECWEMNRELWEEAADGDLVLWAPLYVVRPVVLCLLEPLTSFAMVLGGAH